MKPCFRPERAATMPYTGPAPIREHSKVAVASRAEGVEGNAGLSQAIDEYKNRVDARALPLRDLQNYVESLPFVGNPESSHLYPEASL